VASQQQLGDALEGDTNAVTAVAFSPGGDTITSGSWDGTIRLWSDDPPAAYIPKLCANIDLADARTLFSQANPTIPYQPVCT
jgi:WD40 repeat protein